MGTKKIESKYDTGYNKRPVTEKEVKTTSEEAKNFYEEGKEKWRKEIAWAEKKIKEWEEKAAAGETRSGNKDAIVETLKEEIEKFRGEIKKIEETEEKFFGKHGK